MATLRLRVLHSSGTFASLESDYCPRPGAVELTTNYFFHLTLTSTYGTLTYLSKSTLEPHHIDLLCNHFFPPLPYFYYHVLS